MMKKIALFGTSADPPTTGHREIIVWLSQHYDVVAVWASDNPFKAKQTPLEHRQTMLGLLIEEIAPQGPNIALYPELSSPRTLTTVERARQLWPNAEFTLAIGSDAIVQLPQWHRIRELLPQVKLLVVPRVGYAIHEEGIARLRQMGAHLAIAPLFPPAVSSTAYREKGDKEALTPPVEAYIHREQLYACQDAT